MAERSGADLVLIGRVVKAHGIRGEVVVDPLSDLPERFEAGAEVVLGDRTATIASSRPHQGRLLLRLEGVTDRTAAELLRGRELLAVPLDLADTEAYFVHELVGLEVVASDGRVLGTVRAAVELPDAAGYDLLEVGRDDGSTWLLPAVDEYVDVADVDGDPRLVVTDPPAGLVDGTPDEHPSEGGA